MPSLQYDRHSVHCVLRSVSNSSNSATSPTSWVICCVFALNGLLALFCCRSRWRACRWGWFSIFLTNWRTREFWACFTTDMWQSRYSEVNVHLVQHWLLVTWLVTLVTADNGFLRSIMICFVSNVEVCAFMRGTCLGSSWLVTCVTADNGCHRSIMCCFIFNVEALAFIRWTCLGGSWLVICVTADNGCPRSIMFNSFFIKKERVSIPWERDVFLPPGAVLGSLPTTGCSVLSWSGFGFGWFIWELLNCWTTCPSGRWATSEPNSFIQSCFKEIFGGGRSDAYTFSYMTSPVFYPNNFRDTTSWECFVKNDGVWSCLIERQSFLQSKIDVDPIYRVQMFLPCCMHVICKTRCFQVDLVRILVFFVHGIHRKKEYCLSVAPILTSRYQSRMECKIDCTSDVINVLEETVRNHDIVLQWRINKIASWMTLKSSEVQDYSWWISTTLVSFLVSSSCHAFLPLVVRPMMTMQRSSLTLQNSIAPSSSLRSLPWRRRWINFCDTA